MTPLSKTELGTTAFFNASAGAQQEVAMRHPFDFQRMVAERMSYGFEPIDWPKNIVNQYEAIALTRPLSICENLLYKGAIQAMNEAQNES